MEQTTTKGKWEVELTKNLCLVHGQITMKTKCGSKMFGSIQIHTCTGSICWPFNLNEWSKTIWWKNILKTRLNTRLDPSHPKLYT